MRDTQYYDSESGQYSQKRYPEVPKSHVQAFYLRRLQIVQSLISSHVKGTGKRLIEIGCADGVVVRALYDAFRRVFSEIAAVDISAKMIEQAKATKGDRAIDFGLRQSFVYKGRYDLVVEVGVINYANSQEEIASAYKMIGDDGLYLCSIAGSDSLFGRLKPDEGRGFSNFDTYATYESQIRKQFNIVRVIPVGLFIPHVWKIPALARVLVPLCEALLAPVLPNLFHEKVYLLKPRPTL